MKIIDMLKEKQELMEELSSGDICGFPQVIEGTTDTEKKRFREFQQKTKRFNEICDALHTAYSQTRISVPYYGDISLATAKEYFMGNCYSEYCCEDEECLMIDNCNFLYKANSVVKSHMFSKDESERDVFDNPFPMGMMCNHSTPQSKKRDYNREFMANTYIELKVAIMKAIAETDV